MNNSKRIVICLCMCILNLLYMHFYIIQTCQVEDVIEWTSWVDNICRICFDVWVTFSVFLLLTKGHFERSVSITFWITLIWSFSNVLYSRFFFHYLSLSSLNETKALVDPLVVRSVLAGFRWPDIYFIIISISFLFMSFSRMSHTNILFKVYMKRTFLFGGILLFIDLMAHVIFCSLDPSLRYYKYLERRVGMRLFGHNHLLALPIYANFHNGTVKSLIIETFLEMQGDIEITDEQKKIIKETIQKSENSLVRCNGINIQNTIVILVESYMSFVTDMIVDGKEVTPYLNSLKRDSTVYYNGKVQSNITMGESADGQYILMTGMLPLRSMITVSKAHKKPLPSLVKSLRNIGINDSRMILPTSSSIWRQDDMCKQYGFTHLYASNDYCGSHEQTLTDKQVFEMAINIDRETLSKRFFSIILTATMHQPYNRIVDHSFVIKDKSLTSEMKSYLNVCHYTDNCIGTYLESLKSLGLYNNSLIVITADHHAHHENFGDNVSSEIPLFIINGQIGNDAYHGVCNQVDIYTTIIDVLGIKNVWPGLGTSLLNSNYKNSVTSLKWDVSEFLLLGDFFVNKY